MLLFLDNQLVLFKMRNALFPKLYLIFLAIYATLISSENWIYLVAEFLFPDII